MQDAPENVFGRNKSESLVISKMRGILDMPGGHGIEEQQIVADRYFALGY